MRLELERSEAIFPAVENAAFDEVIVSPDFQALLEKGISAAQTGDRELARKLLTKAAAINPQSEDAWMWLASISNYPEELLAFLNNVLNINPDNARAIEWRTATCDLLAKTFVERGVTAYEEGSLEQAAQSFDLALTHDYDCAAAWFWKSKLAPSDDQRLDCLRRVLSINVDNHEARDEFDAIMLSRSSSALDDAKVAALGGNSQKAVELLDAALENDPANADAWVLRSHLLSSLPEKLSSLEKALAIDPANAAARSGYDFLSAMITAAPPLESAEGKEPEFVASHIEENHEPVVEVFHDVAESVDDIEIAAANDEPIHAVEDMFTPAVEPIDPDSDTIESLPPIDEILELQASPFGSEAESSEEVFADDDNAAVSDEENISEHETPTAEMQEEIFVDPNAQPSASIHLSVERAFDEALSGDTIVAAGPACPFCTASNEAQAFECGSCHATLTVSDVESLLSNPRVNDEMVRQAVTQMEAEWNLREFDEKEMTALGIGHFNIRSYDQGIRYLQEAARLNPNNVILSAQINTLVIRLDEIRRQDEARGTMQKGRTILVVDDSATVRKLISGKLEKSGHSVICAEDGVEGLARIEEQTPDLVLLDITMPRMDGYEVCRQIRANPASKNVPVVMISGKDGFFDKVRGRMAGTTGYVTKPFGPETLMKALETYLVPDNASGE